MNDFASLEPLIIQILSAPGTDLSTVSAKRVRRELSNLDPSLTQEFLKENKNEVDAVITRVYGQFNAAQEQGNEEEEDVDASSGRRYEEEDDETGEPDEAEETRIVDEKPKKGKKKTLTDAELARQLSSEINARSSSRRTTGKAKAKTNGTPKKSRSKKSAATVESDDEDGEPGGKKKSKRGGGGGAKGGFAKEYTLSSPLASLLQAEKMSRPQVVKQLWVYIKENGRQNPSNKREIVCDDALKAVFNLEKVDMFKMNKILGQHLHEDNE